MTKKDKQLVIVGTGETAKLAFEYFAKDSKEIPSAFAVNLQYKKRETLRGLPIVEIERLPLVCSPDQYKVFVAIGSIHLNRDRISLYRNLKTLGYSFASYISSKAFIWDNVKIGDNCFILEHNILQPFTHIGNNVTLWSGNHIGHRTVVKDHAFISSHCVISGFCEIGEHSFLGVNCTLADKVIIAKDNFIGMGSVISKNTIENGLYIGNPAIRRKIGAKQFCKIEKKE